MASELIAKAGGDAKDGAARHRCGAGENPGRSRAAGRNQTPQLDNDLVRLLDHRRADRQEGRRQLCHGRAAVARLRARPLPQTAGKALAAAHARRPRASTRRSSTLRGGRSADTASAEDRYDALKKFARDLTEAARAGKLDPVIGRDEEIRRTIQILARRTKNNPVLIGDPGVGKTAIAEGLALRIANGDVPDTLKDRKPDGARHGQPDRRRQSIAASSRSASKACWTK